MSWTKIRPIIAVIVCACFLSFLFYYLGFAHFGSSLFYSYVHNCGSQTSCFECVRSTDWCPWCTKCLWCSQTRQCLDVNTKLSCPNETQSSSCSFFMKEQINYKTEEWLTRIFDESDRDKNGYLSFNELWKLLASLEIDPSYLRKDVQSDRPLNLEEFSKFFLDFTERKDLKSLMKLYSSEAADFLPIPKRVARVSYERARGFTKLLLSEWGSIMKWEHQELYQDMTQPMSHYFIKASHNTHLVGNQLTGVATVVGYIEALKKGTRIVELDVWDGEYGFPIVFHGHTVIKPITLRSVCKAIDQYAFKTSPYPLILSIENHCSNDQQMKMADIFRDVFKDKLYIRPTKLTVLIPENLKGKILIKARLANPDVEGISSVKSISQEGKSRKELKPQNNNTQGKFSKFHKRTLSSRVASIKKMLHVTSTNSIKEFSALIGLPKFKFTSVQQGLREHPVDSCTSISQKRIERLIQQDVEGLRKYTEKHLLRTYPNGFRFDSSNMDPVPKWNAGVQMVSLNLQTPGYETDLNEAKFRVNGDVGYVLKPEALINHGTNRIDKVVNSKMFLKIKIISGQNLPRPTESDRGDVLDPYVELKIHGMSSDIASRKTRFIRNNGFNPTWNEEFYFVVKMPERAFLRITVRNYDRISTDDFVGQYSIPVTSIRQGYSHVHLEIGPKRITNRYTTLFFHMLPSPRETAIC